MQKCSESEVQREKDIFNNKITSININSSKSSIELSNELVENISWNTTGGIKAVRNIKNTIDNLTNDINKLAQYCNELNNIKATYAREYSRTEKIYK